MTTASVRAYDPYQTALLPSLPSNMHQSVAQSGGHAPETGRLYAESYWYAPRIPEAQLHNMSFPKAALNATTSVEAPSMGATTTIECNVIPAISSQEAPPSVFFRKSVYSQPSTRFEVLQKWEGIVLDVLDDSFTARLIDLTQQGFDEEAEFALEEIDEGDKPLLQPGAIFYWNIGYSDSPSGRARVSIIRFRRLPIWRSEELERAKHDAERLSDLLEWK